jgi:thiosulfate dehydrogenase [quinone] large subunit
MDPEAHCAACDPRAGAVALGRWCLGTLFLFFGIGKLSNVSGFAESLGRQFEKTWLPAGLLAIFGHALPYLETILGVLLLLGLFRDLTLFATGLLLIVLTFGQVLLGNGQVIFSNTCYLFLTAGAAVSEQV